MKNGEIKILVADDHELIRQGLRRIIGFQQNLTIVGEAEDGQKALEMIEMYKPNVVLLDINMPLVKGIEVLTKIKNSFKDIRVIMLTIENDRNTIHRAIDIGADGYVLKDSAGTEILKAIDIVLEGEKFIDKSLVSLLFSDIKARGKRKISIFDNLSKRELEVLIKIAKGYSNKEIGYDLFISEKTVKNYVTNIFRKIEVEDRVKAAILAIENDIEQYFNAKYGEEQ